jgi:D-aspartate ligase
MNTPAPAGGGPSRTGRVTDVPALVLGRGLTALGTLRSLARAGIVPIVVGNRDGWVRISRWYRGLATNGAAALTPPELQPFLEGLALERAVLVPCSDEWAAAVAALPTSLRARFPASQPDEACLEVFLDKGRLASVLDELGLPHPRTVCPVAHDDLAAIDEAGLGQAFLKPRRSQAFSRRYGAKAFRCGTRSVTQALLEQARLGGHELMLQEYVPGPASAHYFIDGFVDAAGRFRAMFARRRLRMHPPDFGNSTHLVSVPLDNLADAVATVVRLLPHVGYRGVFSAEFKHDRRDGRFKLLEVNVRPWIYVEYSTRCGVNVCAMAYRDALGLEVPPVTSYELGRRLVHAGDDRLAGLRLWREGALSLSALARSWLGSLQPVFCWDDPLPGAASFAIWLRDGVRARRAT